MQRIFQRSTFQRSVWFCFDLIFPSIDEEMLNAISLVSPAPPLLSPPALFSLSISIFICIIVIFPAGTHRTPQTLCDRNSTAEHFPLEQNSFAGKCRQGSFAPPVGAVRDGDTAAVLPPQPGFAQRSGHTYSTHTPCISLRIYPCRTSVALPPDSAARQALPAEKC